MRSGQERLTTDIIGTAAADEYSRITRYPIKGSELRLTKAVGRALREDISPMQISELITEGQAAAAKQASWLIRQPSWY